MGSGTTDILILGDPWPTLDHSRDSSLHLVRAARAHYGARAHWALPENVFLQNGTLYARTEGEVVDNDLRPNGDIREFSTFHSVHWRADPPVTLSTMRLWSLLSSSGGEKGVPFVNAPTALLTWNEKFAPMRFRDWSIPGLASDSERVWKSFFDGNKQRARQLVAKPTGDAASRGVQILPVTWDAALKVLTRMRAEHGSWLVIQEFDQNLLTLGETRVFVLGNEICGAINKLPHTKHQIMNLDAPPDERPRLSVAQPTAEQRRRAEAIAQALAADGVYLATIDFIGDRILEINVTSPGLINWLDERLDANDQIARKYWRGLF
ncbi:MAG: hypothetical protein HY075_10800 [Deltaproteobacteria bacterium]|nr:hypothetical protein [Deltaproteobacteria bacterium]